MGNANPPNSPATIDIDELVQGIAEWLPKGMGLVLKAEIQALITEKENRARVSEAQYISDRLDDLHQGTEGAGFVHYGEMGEWLDDRIKELQNASKG